MTRFEATGRRRAGGGGAADALRELSRVLAEAAEALRTTPVPDVESGIDFYAEVSRFEVELITRALRSTGGQQRRAAQLLGLKVTTLNAKIKQYGIPVRLSRGAGAFPR